MKPHEETWTVLDDPGDSRVIVLRAPGEAALEIHDYDSRVEALAAATLAAQAPAMARLLIQISERQFGPRFPKLYSAGPGSLSGDITEVLRAAGVLP